PVATPIRLLEAVVPVEVQALGNVAQSVDLRSDVVGDEDGRGMPVDMIRILLRWRRIGVLHPVNAIRAAERDDLARAVPRPLETSAAVRQSEVENLAPGRECQRGRS